LAHDVRFACGAQQVLCMARARARARRAARPFLLPTLVAGAVGILAVVCDVLFMDETLPQLEGQSALVGVYERLGGSAADVTGGGAHATNGGAGRGRLPLGTPAALLRGLPWALLLAPRCRVPRVRGAQRCDPSGGRPQGHHALQARRCKYKEQAGCAAGRVSCLVC